MRRRTVLAMLGGSAVALPWAARAQHATLLHRIGVLTNDPSFTNSPAGRAFFAGLREAGFVEGKTLFVERRFAGADPQSGSTLASELAALDLEVIVTASSLLAIAAQRATARIPIVIVNVADPIGQGLAESLARPGGNVTGIAADASPDLAGKRLALIKEALPSISYVAALLQTTGPGEYQWQSLQRAAPSLGVSMTPIWVRDVNDLMASFPHIAAVRPDALLGSGPLTLSHRQRLSAFAQQARIPTMFSFIENAEAGGLMAYAVSRSAQFARAAVYVAKILNGTHPGDLPIEQPDKFDLAINLKTAKALGLTIPPSLLARADEVIE